jgi:dTDP-4-dehydrorhamnose 3,5-epimerase
MHDYDSATSDYQEETIGGSRYVRVTVPPGIWFGFQGKDLLPSLVMNITDNEHDQNEELRKPISSIAYNWHT